LIFVKRKIQPYNCRAAGFAHTDRMSVLYDKVCQRNGNQEIGCEKKLQFEEENVDEFEDTLFIIICGQSFA